ncbi:hypothetical protein [Oscillatoria sp. FACHB-1407]|nr:hypothetical protein [Oscillatoria sp. FACHB-1407]
MKLLLGTPPPHPWFYIPSHIRWGGGESGSFPSIGFELLPLP